MNLRRMRQRAKTKAWPFSGLVALYAFILLTATAVAMQDIEHQVKAALMYNFAKFVVWPESAFSSEDEPLTLCVVGNHSLAKVVEKSIVGRTAQGRTIRLESFDDDPSSVCRIVFVDASQDAQVAHIVQKLHSRPVLSIGESAAFAASGGMIRLVTQRGKIRFDVNARSAGQAGIRLRSQLLSLARNVEQ